MSPRTLYSRGELCAMAALILGIVIVCSGIGPLIGRAF